MESKIFYLSNAMSLVNVSYINNKDKIKKLLNLALHSKDIDIDDCIFIANIIANKKYFNDKKLSFSIYKKAINMSIGNSLAICDIANNISKKKYLYDIQEAKKLYTNAISMCNTDEIWLICSEVANNKSIQKDKDWIKDFFDIVLKKIQYNQDIELILDSILKIDKIFAKKWFNQYIQSLKIPYYIYYSANIIHRSNILIIKNGLKNYIKQF